MTDKLLELRIEDLLLAHREVTQKKVGKYIMKYQQQEDVPPILVMYCVHTGKFHLHDGHHSVVAKHFLGKSSILAEIKPCYPGCIGAESGYKLHSIRHIILE